MRRGMDVVVKGLEGDGDGDVRALRRRRRRPW